MDNVVTQEVFKRIDALAEKMGTTAQYLWPKLVAWEFGKAIGGMLSSVVGIIASAIVLRLILPPVIRSWQDLDNEVIGIGGTIVAFLVAIFCVLSISSFIFGIEGWISTLVSPEAAAFHRLLGQ